MQMIFEVKKSNNKFLKLMWKSFRLFKIIYHYIDLISDILLVFEIY